MPKTNVRYFELDPERTPHLDPEEPISEQGLVVAVPAAVRGNQIVYKHKKLRLKPLKKHPRVLPVSDPVVAEMVLQLGFYREIDPPPSERSRTAKAAAVDRTTAQETSPS